jgi:hypothetical protein
MRRPALASSRSVALVSLAAALAACSGGRADERPTAGTPTAPSSTPPVSASAATPTPTPTMLKPPPTLIGDAKMLDDGTIVLDLRHPAWAQKKYAPSDPEYASVLKHLGGLRPGESKGVPPWPDDIDDAKIEASLRAYLPTKGFSYEKCSSEVMGTDAHAIVVHARCNERPLSIRLRKGSYEVISLDELGSRKLRPAFGRRPRSSGPTSSTGRGGLYSTPLREFKPRVSRARALVVGSLIETRHWPIHCDGQEVTVRMCESTRPSGGRLPITPCRNIRMSRAITINPPGLTALGRNERCHRRWLALPTCNKSGLPVRFVSSSANEIAHDRETRMGLFSKFFSKDDANGASPAASEGEPALTPAEPARAVQGGALGAATAKMPPAPPPSRPQVSPPLAPPGVSSKGGAGRANPSSQSGASPPRPSARVAPPTVTQPPADPRTTPAEDSTLPAKVAAARRVQTGGSQPKKDEPVKGAGQKAPPRASNGTPPTTDGVAAKPVVPPAPLGPAKSNPVTPAAVQPALAPPVPALPAPAPPAPTPVAPAPSAAVPPVRTSSAFVAAVPTATTLVATAPASAASFATRALDELPDSFDDEEELEQSFASILRRAAQSRPPGAARSDMADVRRLFRELAAIHMRQVRDFFIELRWGPANATWVEICQPSVDSLRTAAEELEFEALAEALLAFGAALQDAAAAGGALIDGEPREALLAQQKELARVMPEAFTLDDERAQRESVIVHALLAQVPDVRKVTIDKLYAAGLTTLEAMFLATPGDIAATTTIAEPLAGRIVERFRLYADETRSAAPDPTRARERGRLAELAARLREEHEEYERAAAAWSREAAARKKQLRQERQQTLLEIRVLLARLGETELLRDLEPLPFERKAARIEAFLESTSGPNGAAKARTEQAEESP